MKTFNAIAALVAASTVYAGPSKVEKLAPRASGTGSSILPTITTKGNAFFAGNDRFYMRGVDYQPGGSSTITDPLADEDVCKRDIEKFVKLGINTIRIYSVDNTANHDVCMTALAEAGIYLVLDVNTPTYSINRANPAISYNAVYLQNVFATVEMFANYSNTLAFFSGNEVINDDSTTNCAPYVKATTRDIKSYMSSRGLRQVPVGYSAADVDSNRMEMAHYMNCGTDDERSDFFGFNDYSWCDPSDFETSGWNVKVRNFTGYGLPIFLSEWGCITNTRTFEAMASIYGDDMISVYSGGLVYEYSHEGNGYGLVNISGNTVIETSQFTALQKEIAKVALPTGDGGYNSTNGASACPAESSTWNVTSNALPAIPKKAAEYLKNGAGDGPGLDGAGSQTAGGDGISSAGIAESGSGTATGSGSSTSGSGSPSSPTATGNAAPSSISFDKTPMVLGLLLTTFTFFGAALL